MGIKTIAGLVLWEGGTDVKGVFFPSFQEHFLKKPIFHLLFKVRNKIWKENLYDLVESKCGEQCVTCVGKENFKFELYDHAIIEQILR